MEGSAPEGGGKVGKGSFFRKPAQFWARLILGAIFVIASFEKILHPDLFAKVIHNYQILPDVARILKRAHELDAKDYKTTVMAGDAYFLIARNGDDPAPLEDARRLYESLGYTSIGEFGIFYGAFRDNDHD